ncbi:MAG: tetratricopeptide repeat protein [Verrucomicrobia bacterium]|jgi:tetratricopeptide (TPR) repeat protein|nr:tetratricopeptide repeat protein [Verrucomicrobiota bacterium]
MSRFENLEFDEAARRDQAQTPRADEALWLEEADAALRAGDFEQALRLFSRAAEANPELSAAWSGQIRMLIELGEFKEASVWADKALERFPRDPELLAAKAVAVGRLGDGKAALAFSDAAIAEAGESPYVWLARGDVLLGRGENRAEYCFTRALTRAAHDWLWPWLASRIHYFHRKLSLALKFVRQALTLDSAQPVVWFQLGRCQMALGMTAAAEESYVQARQLAPLGTAWIERHELGEAPAAWARWWTKVRILLGAEP